MKFFKNTILILSLLILTYACSDDNDHSTIINKSNTIPTRVVDTLSVDQIKQYYTHYLTQMQALVPTINIEAELAKVKYPVAFKTIQYTGTDPFGRQKILSGLVGYPILSDEEKDKPLEIASLQHGTLTSASQAPSLNTLTQINTVRDILMLVLPSLDKGYILTMPDYFGYGSDQHNLHYYEHRSSLAQATRGMIETMPTFAQQESLTINTDTLYLLGYSEGGFATISTLKSFSENPSTFRNYVTIAGAGAYDKVKTATDIVKQVIGADVKFIASYSWVLLTYNNVYKLNRPLKELFQEEVITKLQNYLDNNKIMTALDLPTQPIKVFSQAFARHLADKTDVDFINILKDNTVSNFDAKGSVSLIHGSDDAWVPTFNTDTIYAHLLQRGVDVKKTIIPQGTHATTYAFFALEALNKMR